MTSRVNVCDPLMHEPGGFQSLTVHDNAQFDDCVSSHGSLFGLLPIRVRVRVLWPKLLLSLSASQGPQLPQSLASQCFAQSTKSSRCPQGKPPCCCIVITFRVFFCTPKSSAPHLPNSDHDVSMQSTSQLVVLTSCGQADPPLSGGTVTFLVRVWVPRAESHDDQALHSATSQGTLHTWRVWDGRQPKAPGPLAVVKPVALLQVDHVQAELL